MAPTNSPTYYLTRYALFYTMAELWGSVVVSLLFWGFANEVTKVRTDFTYTSTSRSCTHRCGRVLLN